MSSQFSTALMFGSVVAIALAASRAHDNQESLAPTINRGPASIASQQKEAILGAFKAEPQLKHTEKLRGPLAVKITLMDNKTSAVGEAFVLRGAISSSEALDEVDYQWSLPKGVELINGQISGRLSVISDNQSEYVELTLRKLSLENVQVHLLATSAKGGARFSDVAQYNSEAKNLRAVDEKESLQKSYEDSAAEKHRELKVFH